MIALLYLIFVVIPFLIFSFFFYKHVKTYMQENKNRNEFFSYLKHDLVGYDVYNDFADRYDIEKYKNYLKHKRNIDANYDMGIIDLLNGENINSRSEKHIKYIDDILDTIYDDTEYAKDCEDITSEKNWLRKLPSEDILKLKVLLLKKAVCFIPICNRILQDKSIKHKLYNNYYIDDRISKQCDENCDNVMQQLNEIVEEANRLVDNWGNTIILEAQKISYYNKAKAEEEKRKKEKMKMLAKKQKIKEKKMKDAQEKAELLAEEIIKEVETKKRKKKKQSVSTVQESTEKESINNNEKSKNI